MKKYSLSSIIFYQWLILIFLCLQLSAQDKYTDMIKNAGCADKHPGANIVTIFDSTQVDVKESGLSYVHFHRLVKVLTTKGANDMRVVKIDYDPQSAYVEIKEVNVYKKCGKKISIDVKNVLDYPQPARMIYWGASEKMLKIGRLEPGDAVQIKLFRKGFTYALLADQPDDERYVPPMRGHYYDIIPFWSEEPVLEKVYRTTIPTNKPLQYKFYNGNVNCAVEFKKDKTQYTFTYANIKPLDREENMVNISDVAPKLLLSTSPDWYAKSKWFYGVNEDFGSFEYTPEIKAKTDEIIKGAKTEMEKISRLTHWVADNIRYSGISMGKGEGYTLHTGAMTFRDRCGVCKDKAGMLVTMLRAAGFKSYAAMTMAGSRIDYIPADQFNHSVTLVKLDGKYHVLDPTWVPFVRELWSSLEQQQQYLPGPPEGADLHTTPISPPENHFYKIKGKSRILEDGTLKGQFTVNLEGQADAAFRRYFVSSFKAQWHQVFERILLETSPNMVIEKFEYVHDPYDHTVPIKLTVQYTIPDFAVITNDEIIFTPLLAQKIFNTYGMNDQYSMHTELEERKHQFRTRCSKLVQISEDIKLPKYKKAVCVPKVETVSGSGADFSGGYTLKGKTLKLKEKLVLKKRIYEPEDWKSYRESVLAQDKLAKEKVILKK